MRVSFCFVAALQQQAICALAAGRQAKQYRTTPVSAL
jgi:hypothetical protein